MELRQIYFKNPNLNKEYPNYENHLETRYEFETASLKRIYERNKETILIMVEKEIKSYIEDELLCNDSDDMFPRRSNLNGEYYIRSIYFRKGNMLSVETALLEAKQGEKDDYLGLEVHLKYRRLGRKFEVYRIDSSAI